jgi:dipeptidyl aminopeptidase/acylaminoacyl peptidase
VKHPTDWSADGKFVVFDSHDPKTSWDLWVLPAGRTGSAMPFLQTEFAERHGRLSPDGRWMAYVSNESGVNEVYVRPFPDSSGGKWKVSTAGGGVPRWRRDGKELFYLAGPKLMSVFVQPGSIFAASASQLLFETRASRTGEWSYDVAPDGQRFVINLAIDESVPPPVTIILNWTGGLNPLETSG